MSEIISSILGKMCSVEGTCEWCRRLKFVPLHFKYLGSLRETFPEDKHINYYLFDDRICELSENIPPTALPSLLGSPLLCVGQS